MWPWLASNSQRPVCICLSSPGSKAKHCEPTCPAFVVPQSSTKCTCCPAQSMTTVCVCLGAVVGATNYLECRGRYQGNDECFQGKEMHIWGTDGVRGCPRKLKMNHLWRQAYLPFIPGNCHISGILFPSDREPLSDVTSLTINLDFNLPALFTVTQARSQHEVISDYSDFELPLLFCLC